MNYIDEVAMEQKLEKAIKALEYCVGYFQYGHLWPAEANHPCAVAMNALAEINYGSSGSYDASSADGEISKPIAGEST